MSKGSGVVTRNELIAHRQQLRSDPNFDENFCRLIDLTEVTAIQVSSDEISFLAQWKTGAAKARRAIVANRVHFYQLAPMYEMMGQNQAGQPELVRFFEDLTSARRWLGLDGAPRSPHSTP